ncbi:MAG: sensor histidine kinase [Kineosporiaceae bacterium]
MSAVLRPVALVTARPWSPVAARAGLLLLCAAPSALVQTHLTRTLLTFTYLLAVAVLAGLPLPRVHPLVQPVVEAVLVAAVLGAMTWDGAFFLPYLVAPVITAGAVAGFAGGLTVAGLAAATLIVATVSVAEASVRLETAGWTSVWVPVLVVVAVLSASLRRVRLVPRPSPDPAYAGAHRLLTELSTLSRRLSFGLEPRTVAAALLDEVESLVPACRGWVLLRTDSGIIWPLAGPAVSTTDRGAPSPFTDAARISWDTGRPARILDRELALPVRMGDQTLAVVVIRGGQTAGCDPVRLRPSLERAAPRLASALLFDQVRRSATVDERHRVAREIHDGIAQDLASLAYLVDDIRSDADEITAGRLRDLAGQVRTLISELRLQIFDLRAAVDETAGLGTAVSEYVRRVGANSGLKVHVSLDETAVRLPTSVEIELLRILQEAVTNVRRHARATTLSVDLRVDPPRVRLVVTDDGIGLQPAGVGSMGITGMRERAARIGARLSIDSRTEGGTCVEVVLDPAVPPSGGLPLPDAGLAPGIPRGGAAR